MKIVTPLFTSVFVALTASLSAEVSVPSLFTDHMVLQRRMADPVWGKASPGESIEIRIADQKHETAADNEGNWRVVLEPMEAGGPHQLIIEGSNTITINDVLVGEVWLCSGQSNMAWPVARTNNADKEIEGATNNEIRLLSVPVSATQEPQDDFEGQWEICTPETVSGFSGVGYYFGRQIQETLGVPVGLIDNARGGSSAEAWLSRDVLEKSGLVDDDLKQWDAKTADYTDETQAERETAYRASLEEWKAGGKKGRMPRSPRDPRTHQQRPANMYNGMLYPLIGYGIQGVIWYQGEANTGRARKYNDMFPLLISTMRAEWGQGDFPFYWVQLATYKRVEDDPNVRSNWATLREAQSNTLSLPNTGQAVIIDIGEAGSLHPKDKQTPANRLARWALAKTYGHDIDYHSPTFSSLEVDGTALILTFDHVSDEGLYFDDSKALKGFAISGEDQLYVWAEAEIIGKNQVKVWSDEVPNPTVVLYAWANNPVASLKDRNSLPVTPFRAKVE